ncbi:putative reverse transcriptase domain-containing protein, partial [Tanacetum coccineum]
MGNVELTGEPEGQGNDRAQVGNQGGNHGDNRNQSDTAINDNIQGDVRNVIIEKMESVQDMSGCGDDQKVMYTAGSFVGKALTCKEMQKLETELWNHAMVEAGHAAYTDRFHELARNGSIKMNPKKRRNGGEPRKDRNERDDNKRSRIMSAFSTTLFDSGADYSFVFTTFIPLLDIEPSDLGFIYEIEIASGQLVEIDKVIRGCKLEMEGYVFDINLIPFGSKSFDVIIGMDWLSNHKAEIICHEKVVRIPLLDGKVLRVLGEKPEEKVRQLMSVKAKEKKQEEIVVVRDFLEVFPDDLSRLPPVREIEFQIELIPRSMPIAKSPYRLTPSELEELSGQLKELQDKGFIRPSSSPWGAPILFVKKKDGSFR